MGLENSVAAEIQEQLKIREIYQSHRNVFVEIAGENTSDPAAKACRIRTADDVFQFIGSCQGIDRTKGSVDILTTYFEQFIIPQLLKVKQREFIRITVSFVGKRNFNRFFVENKLHAMIAEASALQPLSNELDSPKEPDELRLRCHIEDDAAFWGIGLRDTPLHRRPWRNLKYTGQLHPPVAAAMSRELQPEKGATILDPFCGSGTILIESALRYPDLPHVGYDTSAAAVEIATKSAALAGIRVSFAVQDSLRLIPDSKSYFLLSNPPWDEKHRITDGMQDVFLHGLLRLINHSLQAVLLLPEEWIAAIRSHSNLPIQQLAQTRVRGKLAAIIRIQPGQ